MRTVKLGALLVRLGILGKRSRFLKGGRWKGSVVASASTGSSAGVCNYLGCSPELCLSCSAMMVIHSLNLSML